jgi:nucleotide-binding universal stress UspA family protein
MTIERILVAIDFTPCSKAALDVALAMADACGAQVDVVYVWRPHGIFAESPEGIQMQQLLSAAEDGHPARVCGRLEFGEEPSRVILSLLEHEGFDLVVLGQGDDGGGGHVLADVSRTAPCAVGAAPYKAA